MAQVLQLRRGTTAQNDTFTGAAGEVTVDTDRESLRVHDGSTMGGKEIADLATAIPLLTDATTVNTADELIVRQSGVVKRATVQELFTQQAIWNTVVPSLTDATTINAADKFVIQQSGVTKRATAAELAASAPFTSGVDAMAINSGGITLYVVQTDATTRKIIYANPVNGGRLVINGVTRQFKGAINVSTTPYNALTLYYVYAYWTGSAIALELSTTGYSFDYTSTHSGIAIQTGNASRTLVGMVYLDANKEVVNTVQNNSLINWYNRTLNFLAGQSSVNINDPASWINYTTEVTLRYDANDPFTASNWQEIGTTTDNKIQYLHWAAQLGRATSHVFGVTGNASVDGIGARLRFCIGTTQRGPALPVSSYVSVSGAINDCFHNLSVATTFSHATDGRSEINIWGQIVGAGRSATGVASTDLITCSGNTFANNMAVRFTALTGGNGLSTNTKYFVRNLSGSDFNLSTTPLFSGVTGDASTDVITAVGHTFTNNQLVRFTSLTGGSGLATSTDYYVRDISGNTFKLAATSGGAAIDFTTNITGGVIGAAIVNFTTDITASTIDANGAVVRVNTFSSYWG